MCVVKCVPQKCTSHCICVYTLEINLTNANFAEKPSARKEIWGGTLFFIYHILPNRRGDKLCVKVCPSEAHLTLHIHIHTRDKPYIFKVSEKRILLQGKSKWAHYSSYTTYSLKEGTIKLIEAFARKCIRKMFYVLFRYRTIVVKIRLAFLGLEI